MPDETMPSGGGVMRGLAAAGGGLGGVFSAVEMIFAPNARQARELRQAQSRIGRRSPSPSDPPVFDPEELAAQGIRQLVYRWTEPGVTR